ncbi:retrotransposon protein, putative, ty1-copia subclass [Tanacetum coccineum]
MSLSQSLLLSTTFDHGIQNSMLQDVKSYLGKCFAMKDLGEAAYILGIKIYRDRSRRLIGLCQSAYIEKILKRFHMAVHCRVEAACKVFTYASAVGSIYNPGDLHWTTVKNILKYLRNTKDMFLVFGGDLMIASGFIAH